MSSITKLRLDGYDIFDDEEDDPEQPGLPEAIAELSIAIREMQATEPSQLLEALASMQEVIVQLAKKRVWKFDVKQNKDGELASILATEL